MAMRVLYLSVVLVAIFLPVSYSVSRKDFIDCGDSCTCFDDSYLEAVEVNGNSSSNASSVAWVPYQTTVDCRSRNLAEIPINLLLNVTELRLSHNRITHLPGRQLQNYSNLYFLDLSYNEMSSIDKEAFVGLTTLRALIMNHNSLCELPNGLFTDLNELYIIDFGFNNLKRIPELGSQTFYALYVNDNEIEEVCVEDLPEDAEFGHLELQNNKLERFPVALAEFLDQHTGILSNLAVGDNPWVCDCQMADLKRVWTTHPLFISDSIYCDRPEALKGKNLWNIPISELVCDNSTDNTQDDDYKTDTDVLFNKGQLIGACTACFFVGGILALGAYFIVSVGRRARGRVTDGDTVITSSPFVRMEDTA